MATETPNLHLEKPAENEFYDVKKFNANWDKIDAAVKSLSSAAEYSATQTYALGDYCTHDGKLYRCTTAITEAEAWNQDHWTETSVTAELIAIYTTLQNKADSSSVYTKEESISAATRTALSLAETATPDAALAEIARQLSESKGVSMDLLWENSSPSSVFAAQTINLDLSNFDRIQVDFTTWTGFTTGCIPAQASRGEDGYGTWIESPAANGETGFWLRAFTFTDTGVKFAVGFHKSGTTSTNDNSRIIPTRIYGIKL